jgi:hypothetical protein
VRVIVGLDGSSCTGSQWDWMAVRALGHSGTGWLLVHSLAPVNEVRNLQVHEEVKCKAIEAPTLSTQSPHRWRLCQLYAPAALYTHDDFLVLASVRG